MLRIEQQLQQKVARAVWKYDDLSAINEAQDITIRS